MKRKSIFQKLLSFALTLSLVTTLSPSVFAEENRTLTFEKIDNSAIDQSLIVGDAVPAEEASAAYKDSDIVRVSIILSEDSVIDAGYSTDDILSNSAALGHMKKVKGNQKNVEKKIAKAIKKSLKVKQNLAIVANVISAEVAYGDIPAIEKVSEVSSVVIETQYAPNSGDAAAPDMAIATGNMTGALQAWGEGYTGAGARVAIIDTGLDIDHQSFDNDAFLYALKLDAENDGALPSADKKSNGKGKGNKKDKNQGASTEVAFEKYLNDTLNLLDAQEITAAMPYLNANAQLGGTLSAADVVISDKIPFGFNYVDGNTNVRHIYDSQGEHGSHVSGISAANRFLDQDGKFVDAIETVGVSGNAPDAQVIVMKVFGQGGGAYDSDYMAAIEDAIVLNCDSVNLSLGSANAGMATSPAYQEFLDKLDQTDTVVVMSAGNSGAWADNTYYGELYADGVNYDTAGSPGSFTNSLAVASAENVGSFGCTLEVAGIDYGYTESTGYGNEELASLADGNPYDYVFVDGFGSTDDFAGIDLAGKVVFCKRGALSFYEKANNAVAAGAVATIVYNNQPGTIAMNLTGYEYSAPCVSITQADGAAIKAASVDAGGYYTGSISFSSEPSAVLSDADYISMSDFSSLGVPGNLSLKPEITAPGGNIWSVAGTHNAGGGTDKYELMSGTSMAAPQISGMVASLKKFIKQNNKKSSLTERGMVQSLLMSTATPLKDSEGAYYPVFRQGAGLGNLMNAMNAKSVVIMGADATASYLDGKVKAELGDDPERSGEYSFSFTIQNISKENVAYDLAADIFTQATDGDFLYGDTMDIPAEVSFTVDGKKASSVTVKKNKSAKVTVSIRLTSETKEFLDEYLAGAYVEAYVYANAKDGSSGHSIPVLAYYGNWTDPSMYDIGSYLEYQYGMEVRPPYLYMNNDIYANNFTVNFADGSGEFYFGGNLFAKDQIYHPEYASMNNENGDMIKRINYALIRNAGNVAVSVSDSESKESYLYAELGSQYAAFYNANSASWNGTSASINLNWRGTDAKNEKLPEGTRVDINLIAAPEYSCADDGSILLDTLGEGAYLGTSLTIDNTAPELMAAVYGENGLAVMAEDNVAIAAIMLFAQNGRTLMGRIAVGAPSVGPAVIADDLSDDIYLIAAVDYAGNMSVYKVFMNIEMTDEVASVSLDHDELVMMKNNSAKLNALVDPVNVSDDSVIWTSSDESVASVSEDGIVRALAEGQCTITAASALDPTKSAECAVEVISIEKILNGVVWDENGEVWLSEINTAELPDYSKLTASSWKYPINGLAWGADGSLYATDLDTNADISNLYTIDPASLEPTMVGSSEIAYTDIAQAPNLGENILLATYFNYIVVVDTETGDYLGAFKYTGSSNLVGITYAYSVLNTVYNQYIDVYYLMDDAGNLYEEAFMPYNGSYAYFNGAEGALLGNTGVTCDTPYFQSLYFDGEYTFASCYNEGSNSVTLYAIDTESTGEVYEIGQFADGVWPVAALTNLYEGSMVSANGNKFADVCYRGLASTEQITKRNLTVNK